MATLIMLGKSLISVMNQFKKCILFPIVDDMK